MGMKAFNAEDPALPMHYPGFVFRTLREEALCAEDILDGTDLTEERLQDPNHRFSFSVPRQRL